jgi:hypothetical protein
MCARTFRSNTCAAVFTPAEAALPLASARLPTPAARRCASDELPAEVTRHNTSANSNRLFDSEIFIMRSAP